jgi:hypothetical protein
VGDRVELRTFFREFHDHVYDHFDDPIDAFADDPEVGRGEDVTIVGVAVLFADELLADSSAVVGRMVVDPVLAGRLLGEAADRVAELFDEFARVAVTLRDGGDANAVVDAAVAPAWNPGTAPVTLAGVRARVMSATRPYVVALWVAFAVAVLGLVVVVAPVVARQAAADARGTGVLVAVGADRALVASAVLGRALVTAAVALVTGSALAVAATALFPLGPLADADPVSGSRSTRSPSPSACHRSCSSWPHPRSPARVSTCVRAVPVPCAQPAGWRRRSCAASRRPQRSASGSRSHATGQHGPGRTPTSSPPPRASPQPLG